MDLGLKDKVAVVSGSTRGIGRVIARTLAQEGVKVVIVGRGEDTGKRTVEECKALGVDAIMVKTDVTKWEDVDRMVKATMDRFGRVDILVNSAVIFDYTPFMKTTREIWDAMINLCQYGVMHTCKAALEPMIAQRSGRIVNLSSDAGRIGDRVQPIYAECKGAIIAFTKSIALDVARNGITANVVSPSLTMTEDNKEDVIAYMGDEQRQKRVIAAYPLGRIGRGEDVADMVVFLASERASHITGQVFSVNGGFTMPD